MTSLTKRTIQDIFDEDRENEEEIEEITHELCVATETLKKLNIRKLLLEKELDDTCMDLVKDNKISWVECDLNEWGRYVEDTEYTDGRYYMYYYDGSLTQEGYFTGLEELENYEIAHFKEHIRDYFYYGYPNYIDRNHRNAEMTECEMAFESGDSKIKEIRFCT
jgi:hypothetical protein